MEKDLEKDVEKNTENKINENRKFHAILLITILILLFILAFVIKLANDNKNEIISVVDNNDTMIKNEVENNSNIINDEVKENNVFENVTDTENKLETNVENEDNLETKSKTTQFSKDVINKLNDNEIIELVEIIDNKDNTATLNFRKYEKAVIPELTEEQYNELIKNNEIELFDQTFTYNPRVNVLTNNKYVSFELDKENKKIIEYPMTILCKGTDEYYTITCNSDLKVYNDISDDAFETILQYANRNQQGDYDVLSISIIPEYIFNDKDELERINVIF